MSFPLSYARSRAFNSATLPASVRKYYAVDMAHANALLAANFPTMGAGANFTIVAFDVEFTGRKHSDAAIRPMRIPLPRSREHFLRLLTVARDGVVIAFDLLALRAIPARLAEILRDPNIIKVGIELKGDLVLLLRHYAVPVYNGWELSQLWKSMHPSIEVAPLTSHISLDDMARILLDVKVDKLMQTSDWSALFLSVEQIEYSFIDAYILLPMMHLVIHEYEMGVWPHFTASAFSFNVDLVVNGNVVQPGPQTVGSHIRVWGVGEPVDGGDWAPRHAILDAYNASVYSDCRSLAPRRFYAKEGATIIAAVRRLVLYTSYRARRWMSVRAYSVAFVVSCVLLPAVAVASYILS
ncbi:ribonuclease H-like domain-containing protein [Schizophyllum commune]